MTTTTVKPLREKDPEGRLVLNFHDGQIRTFYSLARFIFMLAGTQGGKTSFGPHWLHEECRKATERLQPGEPLGDFLAVTATYDLFQLKMLPEMLEVFVRLLDIGYYWGASRILELREGLSPQGRLWAGPGAKATDPMWGRIILRSAEAESGLESTTAKAAWLDEVGQDKFSRSAWRAVLRRLSIYQGRVLGTTTVYNTGWMKTEIYDRWRRHINGQGHPGDEDYEVVQFDSTMNPMFTVEEFNRAKASMPLWEFNMTHRGQYDTPAGLVFDNFETSTEVIDRFEIPKDASPPWRWYTGHDFGSKNPAHIAFAQDPGTGLLYAAQEYVPSGVSVGGQVENWNEKLSGRLVIQRQGGSHQEDGWRLAYTGLGMPITEPPINDVGVGIGRLWALFNFKRIKVFSDMEHFLDEIASYSYETDENGVPTDKLANQSAFHIMDATRYALCGFHADQTVGSGKPKTKSSGYFGG